MTAADGRPADVRSLLACSAAMRGDAIAIGLPAGGAIGYRALHAQVVHVAGGLQRSAPAPQRIAVVLPNGVDMSIALLGAICAGVAVPLNPAYTHEEYQTYFRIARVDALLVGDDAAHPASEVARALGLPVHALTHLRAAASPEGAPDSDRGGLARAPSPDDLALIMLTSGSTGEAKRVPLTHRNLCTSAWDVCRSVDLGAGDRCLSMWEQFHIGGVVDLLLAPLLSGGEIIAGGSFDASRFFALLEERRPTWYQGVPATMHELQRAAVHRGYRSADSSLRFLRCVAAALPEAWRLEIEATFGVPVVRTFGMTEASPLIASTRLPPASGSPGAVGFPCGPEVCVVDADGKPLPAGSIGEVGVRGDNVFAGYEGQPELNAECFRDGWFLTGDLGLIDASGELFLTGRAKEIINRGGEKISPGEVEAAFLSHPDVSEATAFANPHPTLGEDVGIALVLKPAAGAGREALEQHVAARLAEFKRPRAWLFLERMPLSAVGKVQRRELPRLYRESRAERSGAREARDPLEQALLAIWRAELDNPALGPCDDFADSGGDSLSSLRVVVSVEQALGLELPEEVVARCGSVERMAAELRALGVSDTAVASIPGIGGDGVPGDELLLTGYANRPDASLLFATRSARSLDVVRHALGSLTTPRELGELLAFRPPLADRFAGLLTAPLAALRLIRERGQLARDLRAALARAREPLAWERRRVAEHAFLFAAPAHDPAATTLVVGFASRAMRLTAPTYQLLCALDPRAHALLLLRDPARNHFEDGIPGLGDSIERVADWLAGSPEIRAHREVVALGTSAGAVPALIASLRNGWPRTLLCGADDPANHPRLARALDDALDTLDALAAPNAHAARDGVVIAYSAPIARDRKGADALVARLPGALRIAEERFAHHALLHHLQLRGELGDFLDRHLLAPPRGTGGAR